MIDQTGIRGGGRFAQRSRTCRPHSCPGSRGSGCGDHGAKRYAGFLEEARAEPLSLGRPRPVSLVLAGAQPESSEQCQLPAGPRGLAPAKRSYSTDRHLETRGGSSTNLPALGLNVAVAQLRPYGLPAPVFFFLTRVGTGPCHPPTCVWVLFQ